MRQVWTGERRARAQKLAEEGKSTAEIARDLGCGRNAVIGILYRARKNGGAPAEKRVSVKSHAGVGGPADRKARRLQQVAAIRAALALGKKTHAGIAADLGCSLSWVNSLARAQGPGRRQSHRQRSDAAMKARLRQRQVLLKAGGVPPVVGYRAECFLDGYQGQQGRVALMDLERHHCRFPIDMPADENGRIETRYCGEITEAEGTYCAHHAARCLVPPQARARGKARGVAQWHPGVGGRA